MKHLILMILFAVPTLVFAHGEHKPVACPEFKLTTERGSHVSGVDVFETHDPVTDLFHRELRQMFFTPEGQKAVSNSNAHYRAFNANGDTGVYGTRALQTRIVAEAKLKSYQWTQLPNRNMTIKVVPTDDANLFTLRRAVSTAERAEYTIHFKQAPDYENPHGHRKDLTGAHEAYRNTYVLTVHATSKTGNWQRNWNWNRPGLKTDKDGLLYHRCRRINTYIIGIANEAASAPTHPYKRKLATTWGSLKKATSN